MRPALRGDERRGQHRERDLDDEDQRRHLRGGPLLQRGHLAEQRDAGADPGRQRPDDRELPSTGTHGIGDELGRQPAPREGGACGQGGGDAADVAPASRRIGRERQRTEDHQRRGERGAACVARGGVRREDGQPAHAHDDRHHRSDVAHAHALVEGARTEREQQYEPERQPGLDDGQRGEQERSRLQRPAEEAERGAGQPPRPGQQSDDQRQAQTVLGRHPTRLDRLQHDAEVVERGRHTRRAGAESHRRHGRRPR